MEVKRRKVKKGISLIVLIVIIVIILILSTAIIMGVITNNPISNAKEAVLRNDLQVMKESYGLKTGELFLKYGGDTSKITVEDYKDVVNEKYKGEVEVFEEGLAYLGKDKKKQKVAEEMGYIIGNPNDSVLRAWTSGSQDDFHAEEYRTKITKIKFITNNKVPDGVIKSWDVSEGNNGGVMAWIVDDGEDGYELTIGGNTKVLANINSSNMFNRFTSVKDIDISNFNTENVIDMSYMFNGCESLTSLDVSNFDTSKVTNMVRMFSRIGLKYLDLSNFNTNMVKSMTDMFENCSELTNLNISNFVTDKVNSMRNMFHCCNKLTNLNLKSFNTENVSDMYCMFSGCESLTSLDLSGFNTSQVTDLSAMFQGCSSLVSLNLGSNFNTSQVTDLSDMFYGCSSLVNLNLGSNFDTSQVTDMENMFRDCKKINTNITIKNIGMTSYSGIFWNSAVNEGAQIIVNYTKETAELIDDVINTRSNNSNVIKGEEISM